MLGLQWGSLNFVNNGLFNADHPSPLCHNWNSAFSHFFKHHCQRGLIIENVQQLS